MKSNIEEGDSNGRIGKVITKNLLSNLDLQYFVRYGKVSGVRTDIMMSIELRIGDKKNCCLAMSLLT
jgi:hypothetical protein